MTDPSTPRDRGRLLQVLGFAFGFAVILGNTIGVGILRTPGEIAAQLPSETWMLAVWIAGGAYALLGAFALSELGAMVPRSGGQYVFVRRALGEFPAFVVGWSDWVSTSGAVAATAFVIAEYGGLVVPALAAHHKLVGLSIIVAFALLQSRGIKVGDAAQQISSLIKALVFVALIAACFALPASFATPEPPRASMPQGAALVTAVVVALQLVIYAYDGWTGVLYFGEEVKDPGRDIPRSMIGGVLAIAAIYLLVNLAMLSVLGIERMAGEPLVAGSATTALFGARGTQILHVVVILALFSTMNALLLLASRVPVALGRDRLLPGVLANVSAGGTPVQALFASAGVAAAFLLTGTFGAVIAVLSFFFVASYVLSLTSVFVLRAREPDAPRPHRAIGHPWTTALALLLSVAFLAGALIGDWANSSRALLLIVASLPIYLVIREARRRTARR